MSYARNPIGLLLASFVAIAGCSSEKETLDERVKNVTFAGSLLSDAGFYGDGRVELRIVPFDEDGKALLENGMNVVVSISSPAGLTARVVSSQCVQLRERHPLVLGIVVDASSSMALNDPDDATGTCPGRRSAVTQIVNSLSTGDVATVTDFSGAATTPLRDLVCVWQTPTQPCIASAASLTGDFAALRDSSSALRNIFGTPLYDACLQMNAILEASAERKAMVILSDGLPNDAVARTACLDGARSSNIAIYTVGFGTTGTTALRDLAEATGGMFAPANDPMLFTRLLSGMRYSDGYCSVVLQFTGTSGVAPATPVQGEIRVGTSGASASFEFLTPPRS